MNFYYNKDNLNEIVKNYRVDEEKSLITVTYLDGSTETRAFSDAEIALLDNKMLQYAINRYNSNIENEYFAEKNGYWHMINANVIASLLSLSLCLGDINAKTNEFLLGLSVLFSACALFGATKVETLKEKLSELEKYDRYLNDYPKISSEITINEIDNHTLDDIIKLERKKN